MKNHCLPTIKIIPLKANGLIIGMLIFNLAGF